VADLIKVVLLDEALNKSANEVFCSLGIHLPGLVCISPLHVWLVDQALLLLLMHLLVLLEHLFVLLVLLVHLVLGKWLLLHLLRMSEPLWLLLSHLVSIVIVHGLTGLDVLKLLLEVHKADWLLSVEVDEHHDWKVMSKKL